MSLPGFPSGFAFVSHLMARRKGSGFNFCLYLVFFVSYRSSHRKVKKRAVLTYERTWVSIFHVFVSVAW